MIWLRRKFIWKSFSFVLVTVWCTSGFGIYGKCSSDGIYGKCSSESSRANRTWWRNIHRPTDEAVRTSLPWPTKEKGCITVKKGIFQEEWPWNRSGNRTVAAAGDDIGGRGEKGVRYTPKSTRRHLKTEGFSHTEKMPFRDTAFAGTFRWRVLSRAGRNRAAANCRTAYLAGWSWATGKVHTVWGAEFASRMFYSSGLNIVWPKEGNIRFTAYSLNRVGREELTFIYKRLWLSVM